MALAWKHTIGPGYSGVTIAGERVVSAFSDGTQDVIASWSTSDGRELWRTPIGTTYLGHDGSTDGPVGTATLTDERVYFVGPHGDLLALSIDRGEILWKKNLESEWGARAPIYGYANTPVEVGGVLVLAVGADRYSIVGLDPVDGRLLWSTGSDRIEYSSPVVIQADGEPQVIVAGSRNLVGLDPNGGRLVWTFRHSEQLAFDPTYPQVQPIGNKLLLTFKSEAVLYELGTVGDDDRPTELWRSAAFKNSVAIPVAVDDHLYGFNGTFLTCVELETGKPVWKSRVARGRGVIQVDDHLVILGSGGVLTIVEADPLGYRETARLSVSDHGGYTAPSFANGRIYLRNRSMIASVAIRAGGEKERATSLASGPDSGLFAEWMERIEQAVDQEASVRAFLAAQESFPVVEDDWVHFIYAGQAEAVSVVGQMNDAGLGDPMMRVARSDLFVRSYRAVPGGRWQYQFQVDFGDAEVDPRNPNRGSGGFGESSEVLMKGFADPAFVTEVAAATGRLETLKLDSAAYATEVEVQVYLPADFDPSRPYPLIVMPNGTEWTEAGGIVGILDRLFETRERSALVALVPISGWVGGSWGGREVTLLGEELIPALESAYPIAESIEQRALWTVEDKAAVGLTLAVQAPAPFGRFAFQSPKLYFRQPVDVGSLAASFYVSWSRYETLSSEDGTDERARAKELFDRMRAADLRLAGGEFVAGPGYRTWRKEADAILAFLLDPGFGGK